MMKAAFLLKKKKNPPNQICDLFLTYRHHVIALHVRLVLVLAFVVELPEEVERHHSVEVDDHGQEAHGQHQLEAETAPLQIFHLLPPWKHNWLNLSFSCRRDKSLD